ncbi:MAG: HEAT repeat domain-containing protein [Elusimicrobiaceae bacterium]
MAVLLLPAVVHAGIENGNFPAVTFQKLSQQASEKNPAAIPELAEALYSPNPVMRINALHALADTEWNDNAMDRFLRILKLDDPDGIILYASARFFSKSQDIRAFRYILERLNFDGGKSAQPAARGLAYNQKNAIKVIRSMYGSLAPVEKINLIKMLAYFHGKEAEDILASALEDKSPAVRAAAAEALGDCGARHLSKELAAKISDPVYRVRANALVALKKLGAPDCADELIAVLNTPQYDLKPEAADILGETKNPKAAPVLAQYLKTAQSDMETITIIGALAKTGGPNEAALVARYLANPNPEIQLAAVAALGDMGAATSAPAAAALLNSGNDRLKFAAVKTLARLKNPKTMPALFKLLDSPDRDTAYAADNALSIMNTEECIEELVRVLKNGTPDQQKKAALYAALFNAQEAEPALIALLSGKNDSIRLCSAFALGKVGTNKSGPVLRKTLADKNPELRKFSAAALGVIKDKEALPDLMALAENDGAENVRIAAVISLGEMGATAASKTLFNALKSTSSALAQAGSRALGGIKTAENEAELKDLLLNARSSVRENAVNALGLLKAERLTDELGRLLFQDPDTEVKKAAARALGNINTGKADALLMKAVASNGIIAETAMEAVKDHTGLEDEIAAALNTAKGDNRIALIEMLGRQGDEKILPVLAEYAKSENPQINSAAINAAVSVGGEKAAELLTSLLSDRNEVKRANAVFALGKLKDSDSVPVLCGEMADRDGNVRMAALRALSEFPESKAALNSLEQAALFDPEPIIRTQAALLLKNWKTGK